jgi:hypothetical protein
MDMPWFDALPGVDRERAGEVTICDRSTLARDIAAA